MKILVTGGAGFIGTNVSSYYIKKGDDVIVLDNMSRKGSELNLKWLMKQGEFEFILGDISDQELLKKIFSSNETIDIVFHLSAQVAVTDSITDPLKDFKVNAYGTILLLESIRRSSHNPIFIYSSTNKVYGNLEHIKIIEEDRCYKSVKNGISEDEPVDLHSPYGCSKGSADFYVRDYSRIYDLKTIVFRQSCIYGPHQFGIEDQGWMAWLMIQFISGKTIKIYGNGKQVRDVLYIDDLLDCYKKAIKNIEISKGKIYNIGGGPSNKISLLEYIKLLKIVTGGKAKCDFFESRPGDQKVYVSDIRKAERELKWIPHVTIKKGTERLYQWIKENIE